MTLIDLMNQKRRPSDPWMNNLIDSLFNEPAPQKPQPQRAPAVNISESPNAFEIELATPGINKQHVKIDLEKDKLIISYEHVQTEEDRKYSKKGFTIDSFSRSFHLSDSIDRERIEATYTDGILRVRLVKKEDAVSEPRQITIK